MRKRLPSGILAALLLSIGTGSPSIGRGAPAEQPAAEADPYLWLEDIESPRALEWVRQQDEATAARLAGPGYDALYRDALAVLDSSTRIPEVTQRGGYLYNLWKDRDHPRGIFRRATLAEFSREPVHWESVLDVDALAKAEGKPWTFGGAVWLPPENRLCLIRLSPGGGDAAEIREFDAGKLAFVEGGFVVPAAKSQVAWRDADTLYIATDFGPGSLTSSGYPRFAKRWSRGTPLAAATTLYGCDAASVGASATRLRSGGGDIDILTEKLTTWTSRFFQILDGRLPALDLPPTAIVVDAFRGRLVIWLKADWIFAGADYRAGSLVLADPAALRGGTGGVELLLAPGAHEVVEKVGVTSAGIYVATLDNVRGRFQRFVAGREGWARVPIAFPDNGALTIMSAEPDTGEAFVQFESFTAPPTLYHLAAGSDQPQKLKAQSPAFDGDRFATEQHWAASADGTKVPYFIVAERGRKRDGTAPVWMFSYGGFEIALTPAYSGSYEDLYGAYGKLWLERGGVFVLANIRGGGEFGPSWHLAATKENHHRAFEDFEAFVRELFERDVTSPAHLGIEGRSNGGLLVASLMLRHPELYGAVVCGNPLLDMRRYSRLLAGASWMGEYGDPDIPAEWAYIREYSPYQRLRPGMTLPPVMFYGTTRDDRVHPGHARKMAAKMEAMGYRVDFYENTEGGHHGSVTNEQLATRLARTYGFLWAHLR